MGVKYFMGVTYRCRECGRNSQCSVLISSVIICNMEFQTKLKGMGFQVSLDLNSLLVCNNWLGSQLSYLVRHSNVNQSQCIMVDRFNEVYHNHCDL